ncbi:MAG: helix-turn-helix domain-containing protein [Solirubrobacteraceae bacterium]
MEILSPGDRVALWRAAVDAEGTSRQAFVHVIAKEIFESLGGLEMYADEYAELTLESLGILDDAGLFASDSLRRCLEGLHEPGGGIELLVAKIAGLLREAASVEHLGVERRIRAIEMASQWREHLIAREPAEPGYLSVADIAVRYGVTTQAVYKWLAKGRIRGTRGPGGSWRIPAAQFEADTRPAATRERLDALQRQLISMRYETELPGEEELGSRMRAED